VKQSSPVTVSAAATDNRTRYLRWYPEPYGVGGQAMETDKTTKGLRVAPGVPAVEIGTASRSDDPPVATRAFDGPARTPARSLLVHFGRWAGEDVNELADIETTGHPWYGPDSTGESVLATIERLPPWAEDEDTTEIEMTLQSDRTSTTSVVPQRAAAEPPSVDRTAGIAPFTGPRSTGRSLLEHLKRVPSWSGDDLEERLDEVARARGEVRF
jgi:hypothetical protein